jgi:hypothetical protein
MTQWEKVLEMLRIRPVTTRDIFENYINAPQKVIETLRNKGFNIETKPVKGQKYSIYILKEEPKQLGLFGGV